LPSLEAGVRLRCEECAILGDEEVCGCLSDDAGFVAVLEVGAYAGEVDDERNVVGGKLIAWTDATEFQEFYRLC
jgi:hypothetical protein